ncbi:MAG: Histone deacetylase complex subunit sap18 [Marteilia pararefringens]
MWCFALFYLSFPFKDIIRQCTCSNYILHLIVFPHPNITTNSIMFFLISKICPRLLRIFINSNHNYNISSYIKGKLPPNQLQIYTWMDADLYELTSLIKKMKPETNLKGTLFCFANIFLDRTSNRYNINHIGSTIMNYDGPDDTKCLKDTNF